MQSEISVGFIPKNASSTLSASNRRIVTSLEPFGNGCAIAIGSRDARQKSQLFPQDGQVAVLNWNGIPRERGPFCLQSLERFSSVQSNEKPLQTTGFAPILSEKQRLLRISQRYRQDIRLYVEQLRKRLDRLFSSKSSDEIINVIETEGFLFEGFHMIWHLAEVLYLDLSADNLLDLLNTNFPSPTPEEFQTLIGHINPAMHERFWDLVYTCLLRNHTTATEELFQRLATDGSHPNSGPLVGTLLDILKSKPSRDSDGWSRWRESCRYYANPTLLASLGEANLVEPLVKCFKILSGDMDTIVQVSNSWQERLVASCWFGRDAIDLTTVQKVTRLLMEANAIGEVRIIDEVLLAFCKGDVQNAIQVASQLDWWLVCHLVDLLSRAVEDLKLQKRLVSLRDWFVMNYSQDLVADKQLWPVGLQYLTYCKEGRAAASILIPRLLPETEEDLDRIVATCQWFGLNRELDTLYTTMGTQSMNKGDLIAALRFFSKAKSSWRVAETVDLILRKDVEVDIATLDHARDCLGPGSASDRVTMLANSLKFKKDRNAKDLMALLRDGQTPVRHRMSLVEIACKFINQGSKFDSASILDIMKSLEECVLSGINANVIECRQILVKALAHSQDFAL